MNQVAISNKQKHFFTLSRRWLVISLVLLIQIMVVGTASINALQSKQGEVALTPVKGRADICQIVHVETFSDAWINGIEPGMLVKPIARPFPDFGLHRDAANGCVPTISQPVDVQVIGQHTILQVTVSPQSITIFDELLPYLLMTIFSVTGIIIYLRASNRPVARTAYGLFSFAALIFFIASIPTILWANVLIYVLGLTTWGLATTFVCLLPHPLLKQRNRHKHQKSPYMPLISGVMLTVVSLPSIIWFPWIRPILWILTSAYTLACIITIGSIMFWGLRSLNSSDKQVTRIVVISVAFLLLALAVNHRVAHYQSFVFNSSTQIFVVPLMLLPIVCSYALVHHRFLGATSLFSRQIIRIVLWLLLASFFIVPTIMLIQTINISIFNQNMRIYCYAALLVVNLGLFPFAWNMVRNIGDQLFYHDFYEYNRSLQELSAELAHFHHLEQICAFLLPRLTTLLNATGAALLTYTPEQVQSKTNNVPPWRIYLDKDAPFLPTDRLIGIANLALTHRKEPSAEPLLLDGVLLFSLYDGNRLSGFLCLGSKLNLELYRRQDKSFLATLAAQLSVLEVNNRYLEQAEADAQKLTALNRRVISAQEDERKRLAFELHDEVLQQAILLTRQLSDAGNMTEVAEAMPLARAIVTSLRHTCLELRPPLLDELGLEEALYWLARQTEQHAERGDIKGLQIKVSCIDTAGLRLPDQVELTFYRVVQEALSNVLKHSQARRVTIQLRHYPWGGISLLVRDNGRGFPGERPANEQLGLIGMRERMIAIGGQLQLISQPGRGVAIQALYKQTAEKEIKELVEVTL